MDAIYFRVSTERQTTENQFQDLLQIGEKDSSGWNWPEIRELLSLCVYEEEIPSTRGDTRLLYRVQPKIASKLTAHCVYVEQGRSGRAGAGRRPLFEQMKRDAVLTRFSHQVVRRSA